MRFEEQLDPCRPDAAVSSTALGAAYWWGSLLRAAGLRQDRIRFVGYHSRLVEGGDIWEAMSVLGKETLALSHDGYLKFSLPVESVGESSMVYSFLSEASRSSSRSFGERGPSGIV